MGRRFESCRAHQQNSASPQRSGPTTVNSPQRAELDLDLSLHNLPPTTKKERTRESAPYPTCSDHLPVTVSFTVVECLRVPLVPVMVSVKVPLVFLVVGTLRVEVDALGDVTVTGFGLNVPVKPVTARVTLPLKVLRGVKVKGNLAVAPALIVWLLVFAVREKSGASTTSVTVVVWDSAPFVPLSVRV